jgi:hypothetical protein
MDNIFHDPIKQHPLFSVTGFVQLKDITIVINDNVLTINQYLRNTVRPA